MGGTPLEYGVLVCLAPTGRNQKGTHLFKGCVPFGPRVCPLCGSGMPDPYWETVVCGQKGVSLLGMGGGLSRSLAGERGDWV